MVTASPPERSWKRKVVGWLCAVLVVLIVLWGVTLTFVVQSYRVPSEGMAPTLNTGDHFVVNKLAYRFGSPKPGDVIVFKGPPTWNAGYQSIRSSNTAVRWLQNAASWLGFVPPDENDMVKRIIAVGGQTVECRAATGSRWTDSGSPSPTWIRRQ